jgi:hypothetical protein
MSIEPRTIELARALVDRYLELTLDGLLANAELIEASPNHPEAGRRVRSLLVDAERLATIRSKL